MSAIPRTFDDPGAFLRFQLASVAMGARRPRRPGPAAAIHRMIERLGDHLDGRGSTHPAKEAPPA